MKFGNELLSPLNALFTLLMGVVTVVVALFQTRRITHERLDETIEDYDKINRALKEQVELQALASTNKEDKILKLTLRVGQVEGQNRWLTQSLLMEQQYCQQITAELRRLGGTPPPRPSPPDG
jgi:hypothetical protein